MIINDISGNFILSTKSTIRTHYIKIQFFGFFALLLVTQNAFPQSTTFEDVELNIKYGNMSTVRRIDINPDGKLWRVSIIMVISCYGILIQEYNTQL